MSDAPRQLKSCGFIVFRDTPRRSFLLMKHPNRWDLPKGHVDAGETEMECALRELDEETGIKKSMIDVQSEFRFTLQYSVRYKRFGNEPIDKTLVIFLASLRPEASSDSEIQLTEHQGYEWMEWNPPHKIQEQTIDPLLNAVDRFWNPA